MALFPYGIPKTEKKATYKNPFADWTATKNALIEGLSDSRKSTLNAVLDNQRKYLAKDVTQTGTEDFRKVVMPMIRRILPGVIANDIMSAQPMTGPTGHVFRMNFPTYEYKNIMVEVTKVDLHWNCDLDLDGKPDRVHAVMEWVKENIPAGEYWWYAKPHRAYNLYVNVYDKDVALALSLRWHNAH